MDAKECILTLTQKSSSGHFQGLVVTQTRLDHAFAGLSRGVSPADGLPAPWIIRAKGKILEKSTNIL